MQAQVNTTRCHWIPEGVDPSIYKRNPPEERTIDVLSLGRKFDKYHHEIVQSLERKGRVYLYEKVKGEIIFPTRSGFIDGLANSKISICVPTNVTHPEIAGDVCTITNRYLQSIASKCLIVGQAPSELVEIFGYNPVIDIDWQDPVGQIEQILSDYDDYLPLIDRNYEELLAGHTWSHRWNSMAEILKLSTNSV